jgi:hypothetical protein
MFGRMDQTEKYVPNMPPTNNSVSRGKLDLIEKGLMISLKGFSFFLMEV